MCSFIEKIPDSKIREFAVSQHEKNTRLKTQNAEYQSEISKLKKQLGVQPDGFRDTPSLNIIFFDEAGRPYCEEHGAMNRYNHEIYRCTICGVAVSLKNRKRVKYIKYTSSRIR